MGRERFGGRSLHSTTAASTQLPSISMMLNISSESDRDLDCSDCCGLAGSFNSLKTMPAGIASAQSHKIRSDSRFVRQRRWLVPDIETKSVATSESHSHQSTSLSSNGAAAECSMSDMMITMFDVNQACSVLSLKNMNACQRKQARCA